nr:hypothetical protein Iba_chr04dCG4430 [Ipomoea batatas]
MRTGKSCFNFALSLLWTFMMAAQSLSGPELSSAEVAGIRSGRPNATSKRPACSVLCKKLALPRIATAIEALKIELLVLGHTKYLIDEANKKVFNLQSGKRRTGVAIQLVDDEHSAMSGKRRTGVAIQLVDDEHSAVVRVDSYKLIFRQIGAYSRRNSRQDQRSLIGALLLF